jgi:hypothetical protein
LSCQHTGGCPPGCTRRRTGCPWKARLGRENTGHGLVVIGVHTPEFPFEHDADNVRQAVQDKRITYPVATDNNYAVWRPGAADAYGQQPHSGGEYGADRLPRSDGARVARTARLIAATMLCSGVVTLFGFAIDVAAIVWTALVAGCLAWLSIPSGSWPRAGPWCDRRPSSRSQKPSPRAHRKEA